MIGLRLNGVFTSTIGSFPLDDGVQNRKKCLDDLLRIGIDFPAYPQLKDMDEQFIGDLLNQNVGIISENGKYKLKEGLILGDFHPPGLEPLLWTVHYLEELGLRGRVRIKAPVIGPFTLASYIQIGKGVFPLNTAASDLRLVEEFASIIEKCCKEASLHAEIVSIDEPILSVIVGSRIIFRYGDDEIIKILNRLKEACMDRLVGTHICGRISPKLADLLLRTDLDFLSHEFYDTPRNIDVYPPERLRRSGKILSVGCLSTKNPRVEAVDEILAVMRRFRDHGESLIFTPDCGFRRLLTRNLDKEEAYLISVEKLTNMVKAAEKFTA